LDFLQQGKAVVEKDEVEVEEEVAQSRRKRSQSRKRLQSRVSRFRQWFQTILTQQTLVISFLWEFL